MTGRSAAREKGVETSDGGTVRHAFPPPRAPHGNAVKAAGDAPDRPSEWATWLKSALRQASRVPVVIGAAEPCDDSDDAMPGPLNLWFRAVADDSILHLCMDRALLTRLVDHFYGGDGKAAIRANAKVTRGEQVHFDLFAGALRRSAHFAECPPGFPADTAVRRWRFSVTLAKAAAGHIDIWASAETRVDADRSTVPADHDADGWRGALTRRMADIRLPARSILAQPSIPLSELARLRRGDVIPIGVPRRVPLIIGSRRFATGTIGEQDGRAAFQIETIDTPTPMQETVR